MNEKEKIALRKVYLSLVSDLDAKEITPHLFQNGMVTDEEYEEIDELNETRRTKCKKLLRFISRPDSKCTFKGFVQSLRYNNAYPFLADSLEQALEEVLKLKANNASGIVKDENAVRVHDNGCNETPEIMYEPVRKINVFTKKRKSMSTLAHKLKRLSHDGDYQSFQKVIRAIDTKYERNKLRGEKDIGDRMELADMRFTSLEAEIGAKRVQYDKSLGDGDIFRNMESVIPFTSNPRVSSMTYLARYGSTVAMKNSIDDGLAFVQFAKEHAEYVTPCKDTGMVYYIEVNLLSQKYEKHPNDYLKANILRTSEQGISQFNGENDEIRKDYQRMLLLKMVYCYLGVGLFCKKIENAQTTDSDRDEAKKVMDFIETSDVWQGMEKRRKMLFYVAKSEYYKQQGNMDLAVVHAKEAKKLGKENNWMAELPSICEMLIELENRRSSDLNKGELKTAEDIVAELFDDFSENEDESHAEALDTTCNVLRHNNNTKPENRDPCDLYSRTVPGRDMRNTRMMDLKEFGIETLTDNTNSHRITLLKEQSTEHEKQTMQHSEQRLARDYKYEECIEQESANLSAETNLHCMSYLKPGDNNIDFTGDAPAIVCLKHPHRMQFTEEASLSKSDEQSASYNSQQLMILKERSPVSEILSNSNLNFTLHKEVDRITTESLDSNISSSPPNSELPPPLL